MVHFRGTDYRSHTSCISEAQKYQGHLYKEKKPKTPLPKQRQAVVPYNAYVEDEPTSNAVAVVHVPPKAPSPPPAAEDLPPNVNVFDFLVTEDSPTKEAPALPTTATKAIANGHSNETNGQDPHYVSHGFAYGAQPIEPSFQRYDSWASLHPNPDTAQTPAPRPKSDKKRKRHQLDELDISRARQDEEMMDAPMLHSGLTGGLNRLLSNPETEEVAPSPLEPMKRSKKDRSERRRVSDITQRTSSTSHRDERQRNGDDRGRHSRRDGDHHRRKHRHRHRSSSSSSRHPSRKQVKAIEYSEARADNQLVGYRNPAELFLTFVNKGPDSERGVSINKALKRYHRERGEREDGDKELWKSLRVRRNERGEFVLFCE